MSTELSAQRIGEIGLHILSFEEMPREKWVEGFKSIQELDHAIDDREGFISRSTADKKEIHKVLSERKDELLNGQPQQAPSQIVVSQDAVQRATIQPTPAPVQMVEQVAVKQRIETIITDKGVFFHIDALKERLKAFTTDEDLFMKACANAGVDIFTEYVSEAAKKKIAKAVQDLTKEGK